MGGQQLIYLTTAILTLIQNRERILDERVWDQIMMAVVVAALLEILVIHRWDMLCKILVVPIYLFWFFHIILKVRNQMHQIQ